MLLIKYDGITNVRDAVKHFNFIHIDEVVGDNDQGYYYIDRSNQLKYLREEPDIPYYLYQSTAIKSWTGKCISSLPTEIKLLAEKYVPVSKRNEPVIATIDWSSSEEGLDFWNNVDKNAFHKVFEYLAKNKSLTNTKTNDHETRLQKETSSCSRGAEPKGCIISCKKSCATVTSGYLEYRGGIRG